MTNNLSKDNLNLVIGATGAYGYAISKILMEGKYNVKLAVRDVSKAKALFGDMPEVIKLDILDEESVRSVLKGSDYIYVAFNFPYNQWSNYGKAMSNIISAARMNQSTIVFPGNVYGYGKFQKVPFDESHPLSSETRKGRIRNEIEGMLKENFSKEKIGLILPRFADFYGPNVTNDLFGKMFTDALKNRSVKWLINPDVPHSFTFIEDAAKASLCLVDHNDVGEEYHISSSSITAREFISRIFSVLQKPEKIKIYTETQLKIYSLISSQIREVMELEYEFKEPYVMNSGKFIRNYPDFKFTPYDEGIKKTIRWFQAFTGELI